MKSTQLRADRYQRYSQRAMVVILLLTVGIGCALLSVTLRPEGAVARWLPQVGVLLPVAVALVLLVLLGPLKGDRWDPRAAEAQLILQDEWRRTSMSRALRAAFVAVLAAQGPLGLWLGGLPAPRGVMAMAIATVTLGMATFVGLFLLYQRAGDDGA